MKRLLPLIVVGALAATSCGDGATTTAGPDATPCLDDSTSGHSSLVGSAYDGFGIYGPRGEDGEVLTDADLDECHGHTHVIEWDGKQVEMYHYHATAEFPYTIGCFQGTSAQGRPIGG